MIPNDQLSQWAVGPSQTETDQIKHTRDLIRDELKKYIPIEDIKMANSLSRFEYDVYLQGSYKNSTNIKGKVSDVDIVIELLNVFDDNADDLPANQYKLYYSDYYPGVPYNFDKFKQDIFQALKKSLRFGDRVEWKSKSIKIHENTNTVSADIVPALHYKHYVSYFSKSNEQYIPGIKLKNSSTGFKIINFPKIHHKNGEQKNVDTNGNYKAMVRIFKNLTQTMVDNYQLDKKYAPSYFIENLIYNIPDEYFYGNYQQQFYSIWDYMYRVIEDNSIFSWKCANGIDPLFSQSSHTSWNTEAFKVWYQATAILIRKS